MFTPGVVRVATFNSAYARDIDGLLALFEGDSALRLASLIVLQEMDEASADRVADRLGLNWVYYPANFHPVPRSGFGNVLLSRWPIVEDSKLILPGLSWSRGTQRAAVLGTVLIEGVAVRVVAVHFSTPLEVGFGGQHDQADVVIQATDGMERVIVAGDFNSGSLGAPFRDAGFLWPSRGLGATHHIFGFDHIVTRGFTMVARGKVDDNLGVSDHKPVWVDLRLAPERITTTPPRVGSP